MIALAAIPAVLGLLIGSFLNVVVYRVPRGLSVISPPSSCPRCDAQIRSYDNVPVMSWLLLRGRCRTCSAPISARYPLVEAGTALAFVAVVTWWAVQADLVQPLGVRLDILMRTGMLLGDLPTLAQTVASLLTLVAFFYLAGVSIALALIDLDVQRLPNVIVLPSYLVALVLLGTASVVSGDYEAVLRGCAGLAILWLVYFLMAMLYPGGMGFGDVKLAGVLGLYLGYLGWGELAVGAFAAFLLGGLFAVGLLVTKRAARTSGIPFGPWMLVGAWLGIFFGAWVWSGYLSLIGLS
ncbi:prepilin peptidase [Glaciibacter psychrotolerans]|uniref:Prepilin leader peptidase/N-methyltransferase n=1 Tax=Glaciibacter psychrotolerans TaxID=670054 RepID=A0A7Z0EIK4_9MICO|nr:A24 family peptidase [Leifsonia psychrotolerans]NYJ21527.1 leader peptidase (prepilin peptidase)/N-methyltransferase [Leifsonia psychrotolerans]